MVAHESGLSHLAAALGLRARRIVSEDSLCRVASLSATVHPFTELDDLDVVGIAHDRLAQERDRAPQHGKGSTARIADGAVRQPQRALCDSAEPSIFRQELASPG